MAPKVSHRHEYLDISADTNPIPGVEECSGGWACAGEVALGSRNLSAQSMQIPNSSSKNILGFAGMVGPDTTTMLSKRCTEKTHRTSNLMTLVGPLAPGSSTTRGQGSICGTMMSLAMAPKIPFAS